MTDAYAYHGGVFHPRCLVEAMIRDGNLSPAARDMATKDVLWQFAEANAVSPSDSAADGLPRRVTATADDQDTGERECSACDRLLTHDVSVSLRPDPIERATAGLRPTAREIADLLTEHRRMIDAAGGWASRIPRDQVEAWEARKRDLLARIETHTAARDRGCGDEQARGWSL